MKIPAFIDPEKILPISRSTTEAFKTGTWSSRRPEHLQKVSPCRCGCPAGNNIPEALFRAARGDLDGALQAFLEESPLPGVCGRVCYHPCEGECNRGEWDGAVHIRALERATAEFGEAGAEILTDAGAEYPVAVIGSGPAGLSAAYHLARMGHPVTLIEAETELGGLLRWGIPEYRLPRKVLERDLARILTLGIRVVTGAPVDGTRIRELRKAHRALFIAAGAQRSRGLAIPGMDLSGVELGGDFLKRIRKGGAATLSGRVVVIGGGNAAIDAALSARRLGAEGVDLVCLETREEMPAHERERMDALEEGILFHNGWGPQAFLGRDGRLSAVLFAKCLSLRDPAGKFRPVLDDRDTLNLGADRVIVAIGQVPDLSLLGQGLSLEPGLEGGLKADPATLETPQEGVFAGGDVVTFPGSVAHALAAGKRAALAIHLRSRGRPFTDAARVVMGGGSSFSLHAFFRPRSGWDPGKIVLFKDLEPLFLDQRPRKDLPRPDPRERMGDFREIDPGLPGPDAPMEAERCFYCGLCTGCDRCYLFCPEVSILPPDEGRSSYLASEDYCKGCAVCAAVCPRGVMTMGERR